MQTPDQIDKKIQKYWKLELNKETLVKLAKVERLCLLKLELLRKASSFINVAHRPILKKGCLMGLKRKVLYKELNQTLDLIAAESKNQRLLAIIYKAKHSENLSIIEHNWLQKELKKAD